MSRNNPLRGEVPLDDRPVLICAPPEECRNSTPAPDQHQFLSAALVWTDGHEETGKGFARAWTRTAVLVDVETSRGHYIAWVRAEQVTRRTP